MHEVVLEPKENEKETFEALFKDFDIDDKVLKVCVDSQIENLEEFRFYFTQEDGIDDFVVQTSLMGAELGMQVARVRRAWAAVRQGAKRS